MKHPPRDPALPPVREEDIHMGAIYVGIIAAMLIGFVVIVSNANL